MNTRLVISLAIVSLLWGSVTPAWPQATGDGLRSPSGQCNGQPDYVYGEPIAATAPLLKDLFEGTAHFVPLEEAEPIQLTLPRPPVVGTTFDQKLPIIRDPQTGKYLAFTRGLVHDLPQIYNIFMLESIDGGKTFQPVGGGLFSLGPGQTYLEPHIAIDTSVCPRRYVMTLECAGTWGSMCVSFSTTPSVPASWSTLIRVVEGCSPAASGGCTQGKFNSASTSVSLIDGNRKYVSWT